jgi:hypothetical protein
LMMSPIRSASRSVRGPHRMKVLFPERRRERRYITLKNGGIAVIALVLMFILMSLWSEFRPHSGASANLLQSRVQPSNSTSASHKPAIVEEGSIYDHPGTDSHLLDRAAQDQLRSASAGPTAQAPSTAIEQANFEHRTSLLGKGQRIKISGGSEGLQIHAEPQTMPSLPSPR